jgi:hypothetical protein
MNVVSIPLPVPPTGITQLGRLTTFDRVLTHNQFYGIHLGAAIDYSCHNWTLNVVGKIGLGDMHQVIDFQGASLGVFDGGAPMPARGGLLSSPGDQGRHSRDRWAFVPEVNVSLGYQFTANLRGYVGYDFILLENVVRPGEQTGFATSRSQVSVNGTSTDVLVTRPGFRNSEVDVWLQGIHAGLEFRY